MEIDFLAPRTEKLQGISIYTSGTVLTIYTNTLLYINYVHKYQVAFI